MRAWSMEAEQVATTAEDDLLLTAYCVLYS
jgi:hypothetical protein